MKAAINIVGRWYIFWLIVFAAGRLFFVIYNHSLFENFSTIHVLSIFFHALGLDFSTAAYLTAIPVLILIVYQFLHATFLNRLTQFYFITAIVLTVLISVANTVLYKFWLQLLGFRAIQFLADPNEILASVNTMQAFLFATFFIVIVAAIVAFYFRITKPLQFLPNTLLRIALIPTLGFITFCFIRGGLQVIPINESAAYFSNSTVSNHAAVNPQWYFMRNIQLAGRAGSNPLAFYPATENEHQFNAMMQIAADTQQLISGNANLLFIILESHTADVIEALGGDSANSPCMDAIIKYDALTFTQCYASGFRTDQMLPSLFSGFPAQNNNSIIRHSDKVYALPHLPKMFAERNYHNSFYYAGEMNFANMKSYLVQSGFKTLIDKNNFNPEQLNSKWGAHDGYAFDKLLSDLDKQQQPFFTALLTLSLHEPFELPTPYKFGSDNEAQLFKSAAYYTDSCLGSFITAAKQKAWYKNTLVVIVADHGHRLPRQRPFYDPYTHRIPFIITGGALNKNWQGKQVMHTVSQHDVPAFICSQFNMNSTPFRFSKDMMQTQSNFAYLCYDDGLAWVTDSVKFHFNLTQQKVDYESSIVPDTVLSRAKVYTQQVYTHFLNCGQ